LLFERSGGEKEKRRKTSDPTGKKKRKKRKRSKQWMEKKPGPKRHSNEWDLLLNGVALLNAN